MATDLDNSSIVSSIKRALAPIGEYDSIWPNSTDEELGLLAADAFGQARLEGFFGSYEYDLLTNEVDADLSDAEIALIIAYSTIRAIRAKLLTMGQATRYKAGPVESETTPIATVLTSLLESAERVVDTVLKRRASSSRPVFADMSVVAITREFLGGLEVDFP
jgi:hypothetical protein